MEIRHLKKASIFGGFIIVLLVIFLPGYTKLQELRDKNRRLEERIQKINAENTDLYNQLELIKNDPLYQEKVARETMGIVRKGEVLYKIEPEE